MTESAKWGVIFDVDGTMVDNAPYHQQAWIELGKMYELPIDKEFYNKHIHARSNVMIAKILFGDDTSMEKIKKVGAEKEIIYRKNYRPIIKEVSGLTVFLKMLNDNGVSCGAASNSPRENVDMVLDELNIRKYFKAVIDHDKVSRGKPDPEVLLTTAKTMGVAADKCIVFEDAPFGFQAAERANMPYVVITEGANGEDLSEPYNPNAVHKDFTTVTLEELEMMIS
ncbi:MAG: HAD family phosphatase [Sedimentisphaerales bacterium]|nr:HAD family phosphatase [Sedimentisphaerales bacterium]